MAFSGSGKVWMNGSLVEWADAKIHIASHVIHYGSGVFEGARCYNTPRGSACFRLEAHMRRLYDSARIYRMAPDVEQATLTDAVLDTIAVADDHEARLTVGMVVPDGVVQAHTEQFRQPLFVDPDRQ